MRSSRNEKKKSLGKARKIIGENGEPKKRLKTGKNRVNRVCKTKKS